MRLGFTVEQVLLILTTVVSLEAIYLAIFIQMSINRHSRQIAEVGEDVDYIQENVDEISKDIDIIQEEAKEISADVEGIQEHIEHIDENMEDLSEELEKDDKEEATERAEEHVKITRIEQALEELLREVKALK
jgi:methyl-accepting chemotaxis protein